MKKDSNLYIYRFIAYVLAFALCAVNFTSVFAEEEQTEIEAAFEEYFVGTTELDTDGYIGIPVSLDVYTKDKAAEAAPVILYVINHSMERAGTESDVDILTDLLNEGYIVVTMDYKNNPAAVSPGLDWSIHKLRTSMNSNGTYLQGLSYQKGETYVLPAGCRIMRDVLYFSIDESASCGTFEYIVKVWNEYVVPNFGEEYDLSEADDITDCVKPDGTPIDLDLKMDIIYPSKPEKAVPVFMLAASSEARNNSTTANNRPHHTGFLMRGYACVCYDHEYIPMARDDHYGYFNPYGLASTNGVKTHTAAVRRVRSLADELGYSKDSIGSWGHSKSAYTVLLTDPEPQNLSEISSYSGFEGEYGEQPWLTYEDGTEIPSNVQAAYSSMGGDLRTYSRKLKSDAAPALIACGAYDTYGCPDWWSELVKNYQNAGIPFVSMWMANLGHDYPYGVDGDLGYDRYNACFDFFDYYLKGGQNPKLLYSTPTKDVLEIKNSEKNKVSVKFIQPVTEESVIAGTTVADSDGTQIEGTWTSSEGGTMWTFSSDEYVSGETYSFTLENVSDEAGNIMEDKLERSFEIFDGVYTLENVAMDKTLTSNQATYIDEYKTHLPELVDGITASYSNRWVHNYNYAGTNPRPAYVEIDLDGYHNLYFADVYTGWGTEGNQIVNYELQYLDGDEWKTIPGAKVSGNTLLYNYIDFETPVLTNKVRLYTDDTETKVIRLNEIRIFGIKTDETPDEINVALNKSVTAGATSSVDAGSAPENAVDGISSSANASDTWYVNQYQAAPTKTWLEIDLEGTYKITRSKMTSGYDGGQHRCTDYKLQYWTGSEWADIPGGANSANASVTDDLTFTEAVTTTKVKFISNHNLFRIRELEIYGINAGETTDTEPREELGTKWTVTTDNARCTKVIENIGNTAKEYTLLVAEYDRGQELKAVNFETILLEAGASRAVSTFIPVPESGNIAKAFVWDMDTLYPILEHSELTTFTKE